MRRAAVCFLLGAWLSICGFSQARTLDDVLASGYIDIAIYRDFPPYSFLDENREASGVDVAIGRLIAKGLKVEPRWFWLTADETVEDDLRNAVWKGHYLDKRVADVMMRAPYDRQFSYAVDGYGLPKNNNVVMFGPYQREEWVLARDLEKIGAARNLAIFQYQKIGVEIDSLPDFFLSGAFQGRLRKNVRHYNTVFAALEDLNARELAAVAGMRGQIEWGLRAKANQYDIDNDGLESLAKPFWDIGLAVKHTHRQLGHAIEAVIEDAVTSGEVKSVFTRYGLNYQRPEFYEE